MLGGEKMVRRLKPKYTGRLCEAMGRESHP